jgi:crossover junction endodeoxyribonuclease RuvC
MTRVLGIDPGSRTTGYGVVETIGNRFAYVGHGAISGRAEAPLPGRLATIFEGLRRVLETHRPAEVCVESIFYARNAQSALKLGYARGVALLVAELGGLPVVEYTPMQVKSAVVGYGRAEKQQVQDMVRRLLRLQKPAGPDASDALAVAICHLQSRRVVERFSARPAVRR